MTFVPALTALLPRQRGVLIIGLLWLIVLPLGLFRIYATDEVQYYAYLHSVYFDGDLDFANEYRHFADIGRANNDPAVFDALLREHPTDPALNPATGKYRNVAPVGAAILWSPFYLAADWLVRLGNTLGGATAADGYSQPYIFAVCLASAFYTLLGLILSYRLARRWVGDWAATIATLTIWLASPLVWYTYIQMPWSHGPGMAMVALFLTIWLGPDAGRPIVEQRSQRSIRRWLALAVVGGLMVLVREQLGLFLLLPAIEGLVAYWGFIKAREWGDVGRLLLRHSLFLGLFVLMLLPQLVAYQILYGQPRPSGTVSGKLNLISYKFFHTLFDPQRGAFLWSPILALALVGLALLWRRDRLLTILLACGFLAQNYINGAFGSTWHLSGSFGFRRLLECTPIFVVGLALLIERIHWPKAVIATLALLFVLWNAGLIVQATVSNPQIKTGLNWDTMLESQLEAPRRAWSKGYQLLFDRCALMKNCPEGQQ
ncbi:MAG: hypothetical protein H0T53_09735 [Herpetosiphonaceae bacterium]|nr:hypothetical protein [Herpetosiphonaceae bacterium]